MCEQLVGNRSVDRGQYEQSTLGIVEEAGDDRRTRSEEIGCHARWRVANSQPDSFGRVAKEKRELPEVGVFRHDGQAVLLRKLPHGAIIGSVKVHLDHMLRVRVNVSQKSDQTAREILIEKQSHADAASRRSRSAANERAART